jgi:hypothetical protein
LKETLSASKIKTLKSCSWQYWCKYHLKLPDKTNSGALKGEIVHLILECLGEARHKKHYDLIIKKKKIFASKGIKKLVLKHVKKKKLKSLDENCIEDICEMAYKGVLYDFFGKNFGQPSEVVSEKDFELTIENAAASYKVKGFIDKLFVYENSAACIIRDFKTNKKKYEGKEISDNLQDYIYTLAVTKLYPHLKDVKMEFVFLKQDLEKDGVLVMEPKSEHELKGFELELSEYQKYADSFTEKTATSNLAAKQGMPKDGSFSGKLLCGFASKPNEKKKDGSPKWSCTYKFPFNYFVALDKEGIVKKSAFTKAEIEELNLPFNYKIEERHYGGCPAFNSPIDNFLETKKVYASDDDFF